jgi:cell shape-determining protein MreC
LQPKKRGRKADPLAADNADLRREIARLQAKLERAETIIAVQKKLSDLLGLPPPNETDQTNGSPR